jgi:hypothetical protein
MRKLESCEDIGKAEVEEGRTSNVSDFIIKSPNINKKPMDFGSGQGNQQVYLQMSGNNSNMKPQSVDEFNKKEIKIAKIIDKWHRAFFLDQRGRLYQWNAFETPQVAQKEENKTPEKFTKQIEVLKEMTDKVDGKTLS